MVLWDKYGKLIWQDSEEWEGFVTYWYSTALNYTVSLFILLTSLYYGYTCDNFETAYVSKWYFLT